MGRIKIQESRIELTGGRFGKIAVLIYAGEGDPDVALESAVSSYVGNVGYNEFVDINMDNPWVRVVMSGMNEMTQEDFDPQKHML
jgi:hypothetical protein